MPDYKSMYFKLAAKLADAIDMLTEAQQQAEDHYIHEDNAHIFHLTDNFEKKEK